MKIMYLKYPLCARWFNALYLCMHVHTHTHIHIHSVPLMRHSHHGQRSHCQ